MARLLPNRKASKAELRVEVTIREDSSKESGRIAVEVGAGIVIFGSVTSENVDVTVAAVEADTGSRVADELQRLGSNIRLNHLLPVPPRRSANFPIRHGLTTWRLWKRKPRRYPPDRASPST
jgi:hypothetical protein